MEHEFLVTRPAKKFALPPKGGVENVDRYPSRNCVEFGTNGHGVRGTKPDFENPYRSFFFSLVPENCRLM